jgi:hypothetical protein
MEIVSIGVTVTARIRPIAARKQPVRQGGAGKLRQAQR